MAQQVVGRPPGAIVFAAAFDGLHMSLAAVSGLLVVTGGAPASPLVMAALCLWMALPTVAIAFVLVHLRRG